LISILSEVS